MSAPTGGDPSVATTGELLRALLADIRLVLGLDAELARVEMKDKARRLQVSGGLVAGALVTALLAVATLTAAAVLGLAEIMPGWAAAIVVGVVLAVAAAVLFMMGRSKARTVGSLAPTETIRTALEDVAWVRRETERLSPTE